MNYIPILGFLYTATRVLWAQHQLALGLMTFDQECRYFDEFQASVIPTLGTLFVVYVMARIWAEVSDANQR